MMVVVHRLLRKVFDDLDLDKNGVLSFDEIAHGMKKLGFPINK
jgi:Ca2+-binding EF-hand superfamily protein